MKCKRVEYVPSEQIAKPSCSKQDPNLVSSLRDLYDRVYDPSNGWVYLYTMSRLFLILENGKHIDVASFFKEKWGRLSANRREVIAETMPDKVELTTDSVAVTCLDAWLDRAKKADTPKARKARAARKTEMQVQRDLAVAKRLAMFAMHREQELASAPRFPFRQKLNNKRGVLQWVHRAPGKTLYVLHQACPYAPNDGSIPVKIVRELVPNRIYLVRRLDLA